MRNGEAGYWLGQEGLDWPASSPLEGSESCDVAIVGGGLSGLWTAWWVKTHQPHLTVHVYEAERIGFGASGRNGGWLSAKPVGVRAALMTSGAERADIIAMDARLRTAVHEIVGVLGAETLRAHHGGWMQVARSESELARVASYVEKSRNWDIGDDQLRVLTKRETLQRINVSGALGSMYSPDGYTVDPARMLAALASRAVDAGVVLRIPARVDEIAKGALRIGANTVTPRWVVVATEGYTARQSGQRRSVLPLNSSLLVTEPLRTEDWQRIGWGQHEGVSGSAHTYFYARPTEDGRIALGGRGKPYNFASSFVEDGRLDDTTIVALERTLNDLFPGVDAAPAHAWSGILGVARDWSPFVEIDRSTRIIRLGGYAGSGVTAAYAAAEVAADLILDRKTSAARSPWVRPVPSKWEPEPLRWIGANALYAAYRWADVLEARQGGPSTSRIAKIADKLARRG